MPAAEIELEIRKLPGVLVCQVTPAEVLVLVSPTADPAGVAAAVEAVLAAFASRAELRVVGGRVSLPGGRTRRRSVVVTGAAASMLVVASVAAALESRWDGLLGGSDERQPRSSAASGRAAGRSPVPSPPSTSDAAPDPPEPAGSTPTPEPDAGTPSIAEATAVVSVPVPQVLSQVISDVHQRPRPAFPTVPSAPVPSAQVPAAPAPAAPAPAENPPELVAPVDAGPPDVASDPAPQPTPPQPVRSEPPVDSPPARVSAPDDVAIVRVPSSAPPTAPDTDRKRGNLDRQRGHVNGHGHGNGRGLGHVNDHGNAKKGRGSCG